MHNSMQTTVTYNDINYYVSTIYRECSASAAYGHKHYETLVFSDNREILYQSEGLHAHFDTCRKIIQDGPFWNVVEEDDDDD